MPCALKLLSATRNNRRHKRLDLKSKTLAGGPAGHGHAAISTHLKRHTGVSNPGESEAQVCQELDPSKMLMLRRVVARGGRRLRRPVEHGSDRSSHPSFNPVESPEHRIPRRAAAVPRNSDVQTCLVIVTSCICQSRRKIHCLVFAAEVSPAECVDTRLKQLQAAASPDS